MAVRSPRQRTLSGLAALALAPLVLSACSAGSLGSSDEEGGGTSITFLVDNAPQTVSTAEALVADFNASQDEVTVQVETRPHGADADNLVKTRLQPRRRDDVVAYLGRVLFQQPGPQPTRPPLTV